MIDKVKVYSDYNKTTNSVRLLVKGVIMTVKPMNKKKGVYPPYRLQGSIIDIYDPWKNSIYKVRTEIYTNKEDALERFEKCFYNGRILLIVNYGDKRKKLNNE
jgi:hypothetical protein